MSSPAENAPHGNPQQGAARHGNPAEHAFERSRLWTLKTRLQWTGWLQYLPNAIVGGILLLGSGIAAVLGSTTTATVALVLAIVAIGNLVYDIATVRYGLHPTEPVPRALDDHDGFEVMRARVSCRSFQRRNLTGDHHDRLLQIAEAEARRRLGTAPIRFEYVAAPLTVWPVVGAHEFLVAIAPRAYERSAIVDVGRSLQSLVIEVTRMGIATCWIGPGADQQSVIASLGDRFDPVADHVVCLLAVGYRSAYKPVFLRILQRSQRRRKSIEELFFIDGAMSRPIDPDRPPFDRYDRCYEVCQWSPSSYNGQTTRVIAVTTARDGEETTERFDFGATTRSRYYAPVAVGIWMADWEAGCRQLGVEGRWAVVPEAERSGVGWPEEGRYDMSWIPVDAQRCTTSPHLV